MTEIIFKRWRQGDSYVVVTQEELLYLQVKGQVHALTEKLCQTASRFIYIIAEVEGAVSFMHLTFLENYESIKREGLRIKYSCGGQSAIDGIYALRADCSFGLQAVTTVLADMFSETNECPLVCQGHYTGKYHIVANSASYNYIIFTNDVQVNFFHILLNGKLVEYEGA